MSETPTPSAPTDAFALATALPNLASEAAEELVRVQGHRHRGATGVRWPGRDDLVVTALHGLEREDTVDVTTAAGATSRAELIGRDPALDLALLKLEATAPASTRRWRTGESLRVAEPVLTLARPGESVRAALAVLGVVGGPVRLGHGGSLDRYLELDRDLPRGFSGGLVLDLAGQAVGLAMRGVVRGASVVVGTTTLQRVVPLLETHGHLPRGYIGVGVYPARLPAEHALRLQRRGAVVVVALQDDGPAQKAGVRIGDIVIAVDDEAVMSPNDLRAALEDRAGRRVTLSVIRGTETVRIDVEATQAA
ncbi:MAG: S1C family serine protease [Nannocystaceae bacterium]